MAWKVKVMKDGELVKFNGKVCVEPKGTMYETLMNIKKYMISEGAVVGKSNFPPFKKSKESELPAPIPMKDIGKKNINIKRKRR